LLRHLDELRMIERVQRFPAQLQASVLSKRNRLRQVEIEIVCAARMERIAADCCSVGEPSSFYPVHIGRVHTSKRVWVLIASCAAREKNRTGAERRVRITDIRPVR